MFEVAHQIGLLPIAAMLLLGRGMPGMYWLVAFAFAMSWLGDAIARGMGGSWASVYWWLPVQFGLVLVALLPNARLRLWLLALMAATLGSYLLSAPGPDWLLTVIGSALVLWHACGAIAIPLAVYFGAGSLAYIAMIVTMGGEHFMAAWYGYQTCRALALGLFVVIVLLYRGGHSWTLSSSPRKCSPG